MTYLLVYSFNFAAHSFQRNHFTTSTVCTVWQNPDGGTRGLLVQVSFDNFRLVLVSSYCHAFGRFSRSLVTWFHQDVAQSDGAAVKGVGSSNPRRQLKVLKSRGVLVTEAVTPSRWRWCILIIIHQRSYTLCSIHIVCPICTAHQAEAARKNPQESWPLQLGDNRMADDGRWLWDDQYFGEFSTITICMMIILSLPHDSTKSWIQFSPAAIARPKWQ